MTTLNAGEGKVGTELEIPESEDTAQAREHLADLLHLEVSRPAAVVQAIDILIEFKIADMLDAMADRIAKLTKAPDK